MRERISVYKKYFSVFCFILLLLVIVGTGNKKETIVAYNTNSVKSVQATYLENTGTDVVSNSLVAKNGLGEAIDLFAQMNMPVSFNGKLTGYGPDCKGCGGGVACPPGQNVKNGNIYFNDQMFGTVRIIAADKKLPCGSIIRINGINIYNEPVIAVVMDRGGAVKNNHIDLLFETEKNMHGFSTHKNIQFDILRLGW